jgi:hypothetical protein
MTKIVNQVRSLSGRAAGRVWPAIRCLSSTGMKTSEPISTSMNGSGGILTSWAAIRWRSRSFWVM